MYGEKEKEYKDFYGEFSAWEVADRTWIINFSHGHNYVFLLEGDEKALLIDTAYGYGNLRAFAQKLTDKPIIAANTHWHVDHIGGNGEFEQVLVSKGWEKDEDLCNWMKGMMPYPIAYDKMPYPDYEKKVVRTGDVIDLGGRQIEVFDALPAHSNSGLYFLDRKNRLFFCGDDLEPGENGRIQMGMDAMMAMMMPDKAVEILPLKTRLENMKLNYLKMKELSRHFDLVFPCHNGCPISKNYIDSFIGLMDGIMAKEVVPADSLNGSVLDEMDQAAMMACLQYKNASIYVARSEYAQLLENI